MMYPSHRRLVTGTLALAWAAAGCGEDPTVPALRTLDRPSDIAFACYGDMRIAADGEETSPDDPVVTSAQPLASCESRAAGTVPPGQGALEEEPALYAFALQRSRGSIAVIDAETRRVRDSDPLTPGTTTIPLGTLPVGLESDTTGCYLASANAGSCDLSYLNVTTAVDPSVQPEVSRLPVTSASGERVRARPQAIATLPQSGAIGLECPEQPEGLVYIAYPQCNLVAAVDLATGEVVAGLREDADGAIQITGGDVSCEAECSAGAITPETAELQAAFEVGGPLRPVTLHMADDGSELLVGADNSPRVLRVALDEEGLPATVDELELQGEVGVLEMAVSSVVNMGGDSGTLGGVGHEAQFLYAVATDGTIRVADLLRGIECDTQVDPRLLYDETDVSHLSCIPAGGLLTPARRHGARSPGIHLPRGEVPLDVAFVTLDENQEAPPSPVNMVGEFAFITTTAGLTYVANVDDDNYPDFEDPDNPRQVFLQLALPHTLRDLVPDRHLEPTDCQEATGDSVQLPPRLIGGVAQGYRSDQVAPELVDRLPELRQVECTNGDQPVSELSYLADTRTRELAFPDLGRVQSENWTVAWEGRIPGGRDSPGTALSAALDTSGDDVAIVDGAARFCSLGVQPFDIAELRGCSPTERNVCGVGKECFVHPDQPPEVQRGLCLPSDRVEELSDSCRDVLLTRRRYAVEETSADRLVIGERRRVLASTPLDGCESNAQCAELAEYERSLAGGEHPIEAAQGDEDDGAEFAWECAADPTRAPGPDRCQMACESDDDCEGGTACSGGFCVEGVLPPAECAPGVSRFELRVGDAFAVVGATTGFLHGQIADEETGECVADPDAHPLATGRIPLDVPDCTTDAIVALSPNPCRDTVEHVEVQQQFEVEDGQCVPGDEVQRVREAPAIRYRNPALTFHLVDFESTGDAQCIGDRQGDLPVHAPVAGLPELGFQIGGGFVPMFALSSDHATFARRIVRGPLGNIWVLDEGEASDAVKGRVLVLEPGAAEERFNVAAIE